MLPGRSLTNGNPFIGMLVDSLKSYANVIDFTWRSAFFGSYDVIHVHWPEYMTRNPKILIRLIKGSLLIGLVALNRIRGREHISTIHNLAPHERGPFLERQLLKLWRRSCRVRIYMSQSALNSSHDRSGIVIPHGDYAPFVINHTSVVSTTTSGSVLMFGYLRKYKGVEALIEAFGHLSPSRPDLTLTIAGLAQSPEYAKALRSLASGIPRLYLQPDAELDDDDLVSTITSSAVVVLPYKNIYNSGAVLMALSLGRPVIVTASPSMSELQDEVGDQWLYCVKEDWTALSLERAIDAIATGSDARTTRTAPFRERSWNVVARKHAQLYNQLTGLASASAGDVVEG